jgi:hypothetical protein
MWRFRRLAASLPSALQRADLEELEILADRAAALKAQAAEPTYPEHVSRFWVDVGGGADE